MRTNTYTWADAIVLDSNNRLTLVTHLPGRTQPFAESIAMKLGIAGFVVVWLAVWEALVIASTMSKTLEEHNALLVHLAQHDDLTGLPNRNLLRDRVEQALSFASRNTQNVALLVMDLDRYKDVNDTLGHPVGDELLRKVARRLTSTLRASDSCARLGGDEFAIVLPNTTAEGAMVCARKVTQALDSAIVVGGLALQSETSIGIAIFPEHGNTIV